MRSQRLGRSAVLRTAAIATGTVVAGLGRRLVPGSVLRSCLGPLPVVTTVLVLAAPAYIDAQRGQGPPAAPPTARMAAAIDLTGTWISVITEDWALRMVTPQKGNYMHLPLTPDTEGLLGPEELSLMQRHAILINTARGAIVVEEALSAALATGAIGGTGLDVYAEEPSIPPALAQHPRALVLPHLGSATHSARHGMWRLAAANARAVLEGREAPNPVRP